MKEDRQCVPVVNIAKGHRMGSRGEHDGEEKGPSLSLSQKSRRVCRKSARCVGNWKDMLEKWEILGK